MESEEIMTKMTINLGERSYPILIGKGLLSSAKELLNISGKALILTDSGVPRQYAQAVLESLGSGRIYTVPEGEGSKSLSVLEGVLTAAADMRLSRKDAIVAVGGGMVGDLGGFAAAIYMRGIKFYNIPTTMLSMVDSSIGGKTAVNLGGAKNIVGAFHQPSGVLIDTDTLATLEKRHISAGLCEAVKRATTSDAELFSYSETASLEQISDEVEKVIYSALSIKKAVVEEDEKEAGLRKILNLGHTIGHGIEAERHGALYHGECVALGMLAVVSDGVKARLMPIFEKLGLPTEYDGDIDVALEFASQDKKADGSKIEMVFVDEVGKFRLEKVDAKGMAELAKAAYGKK